MVKIRRNQVIYIVADIISAILTVIMTFGLRSNWTAFSMYSVNLIIVTCIFCMFFTVVAGYVLGSYNSIWVYIGFSEVFKQILIVTLLAIAAIVMKVYFIPVLTYSDIILFWGIELFFTVSTRAYTRCRRWIEANLAVKTGHTRKAIIIGAGAAGCMIIKRLRSNEDDGIFPIAAVDDDESKQGIRLAGVAVCGKISDIEIVAKRFGAQEIIIAIPSATPEQMDAIYRHCVKTRLPIKIFQSVVEGDSIRSNKKIMLSEVPLEELLCRASITTESQSIRAFVDGKTVLVTGGAGSIGSELCRQILKFGCSKLVIFDINENGLFSINEELKGLYSEERYALCVGSVQDKKRIDQMFRQFRPDIVFHAAAHKHVPMMEANPIEAVKNNVFGTQNVINACIDYHVSRFILISTDKAVHPTSIMGATKRMAELLVRSMNGRGCQLAAVRFGNVLGSNGSVVPTFRKQIEMGGPVTVTHRDIKRYFMTIPEAVLLVLCAGSQAKGGEIFVLDMGDPIRIYDLACHMIRLSGLEPEKDIQIKFTGLRPGEKLYEELSLDSESIRKTESDKIFVMSENLTMRGGFELSLDTLKWMISCDTEAEAICRTVFHIVNNSEETGVDDVSEQAAHKVVHAV